MSVDQRVFDYVVVGIGIVSQVVTGVILIVKLLLCIRGFCQRVVRSFEDVLRTEIGVVIVKAVDAYSSGRTVRQLDFQPDLDVSLYGRYGSFRYGKHRPVYVDALDALIREPADVDDDPFGIADGVIIFSVYHFLDIEYFFRAAVLFRDKLRTELLDRVVESGLGSVIVGRDKHVRVRNLGIERRAVRAKRVVERLVEYGGDGRSALVKGGILARFVGIRREYLGRRSVNQIFILDSQKFGFDIACFRSNGTYGFVGTVLGDRYTSDIDGSGSPVPVIVQVQRTRAESGSAVCRPDLITRCAQVDVDYRLQYAVGASGAQRLPAARVDLDRRTRNGRICSVPVSRNTNVFCANKYFDIDVARGYDGRGQRIHHIIGL